MATSRTTRNISPLTPAQRALISQRIASATACVHFRAAWRYEAWRRIHRATRCRAAQLRQCHLPLVTAEIRRLRASIAAAHRTPYGRDLAVLRLLRTPSAHRPGYALLRAAA